MDGFNLAEWHDSGLRFAAASNIGLAELAQFEERSGHRPTARHPCRPRFIRVVAPAPARSRRRRVGENRCLAAGLEGILVEICASMTARTATTRADQARELRFLR